MADYTVQLHDNLTKIAKAHNTTVQKLVELNNIADSNLILVNQKLKLPEELSNNKQADTGMMDRVEISGEESKTAAKEQAEMLTAKQEQIQDSEKSNSLLPYVAAGAVGGVTVLGAQKLAPYAKKGAIKTARVVKSATETAQLRAMYAKDAAKKNAKSVRAFLAQKAEKAKKSIKSKYTSAKTFVKGKAEALKAKANAAKATSRAAAKNAQQSASSAIQNAKQSAARGLHKAKVRGRYARFVGNTKVAPKILKGAGRLGTPLMVAVGIADVGSKLRKGDKKGAAIEGAALAGAWAGAKLGAAAGSFAGPIGGVVGGFIGGVAGYIGTKYFVKA